MARRKLVPETTARGALARELERSGGLTPADADRAADEVARGVTMLMVELCGAAWLALEEHVLFDRPAQGTVVGRDRMATEIYVAALDYIGAVLGTHAAETHDVQPWMLGSAMMASQMGPLTRAQPTSGVSRRFRRETTISPAVETRWAAHLRRLAWQHSTPMGFGDKDG